MDRLKIAVEASSSPEKQASLVGNRSTGDVKGISKSLAAVTAAPPDWRLRDRMKTVGVGLVMALNVGTGEEKPNKTNCLQEE